MPREIMVVAAHADDEALGCGGTIAQHAANGDNVHIVFLTDGVSSRESNESTSQVRSSEAAAAAAIMAAASITQLNFPDNKIDSIPLLEVIQEIETVARPLAPEIVYTHHAHDLNIDHRTCHQAVLTAFRPVPGQSVRAIYCFEVPSSTEWAFGSQSAFAPQHFVDISTVLEIKMQALAAYKSEMRSFPHARSLEAVRALAQWRGASVGCEAAEAFTILRTIKDYN